jgi:hypothetical protein
MSQDTKRPPRNAQRASDLPGYLRELQSSRDPQPENSNPETGVQIAETSSTSVAFTTSMVVVGRRSKMSQKAASRPLRAGLLHRVQYANLQFCAVVCVEQECAHVFCRFPGQVSGWFWAGVAQLVEHLICNQRVGGSNPFASSTRRIETGAEKRQ